MVKQPIYRITFLNQGQAYEIFAHEVHQSDLFGFIEIEQLIFGSTSQVLIDPGEEKLKAEFDGVTRTYVPMHAIVRIDEVEREGVAKATDLKGDKIMPFPMLIQPGKTDA